MSDVLYLATPVILFILLVLILDRTT